MIATVITAVVGVGLSPLSLVGSRAIYEDRAPARALIR